MRKVLFLIVAVLLAACSSTPEERAEKLMTDVIKELANDPSSVQDVKVFMQPKKELDAKGNVYKRYVVHVNWREKNAYGGLVKRSTVAKMNEDVTEIIKCALYDDAMWCY